MSPPDENPSGLGVFEFPLTESNYYDDKETGMRYAMMRDCYDTATGRFCQSDPIGLAGGSLSPYLYVNNAPLNFTDPEGLWVQQLGEKLLKDLTGKTLDELMGRKPTAPAIGSGIGKQVCKDTGGRVPDPDRICREKCLEKIDMTQAQGAAGWLEDCVKACVAEIKACKPSPSSALSCPVQ